MRALSEEEVRRHLGTISSETSWRFPSFNPNRRPEPRQLPPRNCIIHFTVQDIVRVFARHLAGNTSVACLALQENSSGFVP